MDFRRNVAPLLLFVFFDFSNFFPPIFSLLQLIAGQQPQQPRMKVCMIPIKSNLNSCRIKTSRIILVISIFQVRKENERILRVVQSFGDRDNMDNMEYLRGIGYNLNY